MLEKDIVAAIKRYLARWAMTCSSGRNTAAVWRIRRAGHHLLLQGTVSGLEAKLPGGRLTALQKRALERINRAGGIARRVESVDDVKAIIAQADRETKGVETP